MKLALMMLPFFSISSLFADENPHSPTSCRTTLKHIESGGVGYNNGYTTLETFIIAEPGFGSVSPFFDARGHLFDNGTLAANGGIGLRGELGNRIYGINTYYDYRGTKHLNYNQVIIGLETLGSQFDARINGYLPICKKNSSSYDTKFGYFSDHFLFLSENFESAMKGIDAELGFHKEEDSSWNFYLAAGPYCFQETHASTTWGGKIRASIGYSDWIAFEVIESYDPLFHNKTQGQITLSMPGSTKTEKQSKSNYSRWMQPVVRNEIIAIDQKHKNSVAIDPLTGSPYYFVFVDNTSASEGTFESPYHSLSQAENNSSANHIIYIFPGDNTTTNMDHGITLKENQKLWGSVAAHHLDTAQGAVAIPQMSTTAPQITNIDLLQAGATLSTNNEIRGITFTNTSGEAVFGTDPVAINLSSCSFIGCGQRDLGIYPIKIQTSSPFTAIIENNNFTDNTNGGPYIQLFPGATSTQIAMNNNQASHNQGNSGGAALLNIEAHGSVGTCELTMVNNNFENNSCAAVSICDFNTPHEGAFSSFQGTFTANTFKENMQGITFATNADNCTLTIKDNDLSNCTNGSIAVLAGAAGTQLINNATIVIDSNQINGGGADAITISPAGSILSLAITNNSISDNEGTAFVSFFNQPGPDATLLIDNNVMTHNLNEANFNASGGISFDGFNSLFATIENNIFSNNAQGNSIGKNGNSFLTTPETSIVIFKNNQLTEGDIFDFEFFGSSPAIGTLTISGNTGTEDPTYTFQQQGSGSCFITPENYETVNTGTFNLYGVTPSPD